MESRQVIKKNIERALRSKGFGKTDLIGRYRDIKKVDLGTYVGLHFIQHYKGRTAASVGQTWGILTEKSSRKFSLVGYPTAITGGINLEALDFGYDEFNQIELLREAPLSIETPGYARIEKELNRRLRVCKWKK